MRLTTRRRRQPRSCSPAPGSPARRRPTTSSPPLQIAVACAPPPVYRGARRPPARAVSSAPRTPCRAACYGQLDTLVIDGGTDRRRSRSASTTSSGALATTSRRTRTSRHGVQTSRLDPDRRRERRRPRSPRSITPAARSSQGDVPSSRSRRPALPADIDRVDTTRRARLQRSRRTCCSGRTTARPPASASSCSIERGAHDELAAGRHVAFYRDVTPWWARDEPSRGRRAGCRCRRSPKAWSVESGPSLTLVRITSARDAVSEAATCVVPRRK